MSKVISFKRNMEIEGKVIVSGQLHYVGDKEFQDLYKKGFVYNLTPSATHVAIRQALNPRRV